MCCFIGRFFGLEKGFIRLGGGFESPRPEIRPFFRRRSISRLSGKAQKLWHEKRI
jgi:hypothetical protein